MAERKGPELNIVAAGAAGQGIETLSMILGKAFVRGGWHVFALQDKESRIRGGHNFFHMRVSRNPVGAAALPLDLVVALTEESVQLHAQGLAHWGAVLYDSQKGSPPADEKHRQIGLPFEQIATDAGGGKIYANSVAAGAALGILDWDPAYLEEYLISRFPGEAGERNARSARAGYEEASKLCKDFQRQGLKPTGRAERMLITGHEAACLGAIAAGCRFFSAYPMSPSTGILTFLAEHGEPYDMVVEQAEDEIAAINMAIGASYGGVRAMTATSGGGFSLMVEAFGLAAISETPLVIVEGQRAGPATGLPTRTEQGDLLFVLHAAQGEFPRFVFAPATPGEAFALTVKAFDLAEKYQVPAVVLTDEFLADCYFTEERFDLSGIRIDRHMLTEEEAHKLKEYRRYRITESGISPRCAPSAFGFEVAADSHEHDEWGHITEEEELRKEMTEKRFRKMGGMEEEISPPRTIGPPEAEYLLVSWGSTLFAVAEAIETLNREGVGVRGVHFSEVWPFPRRHAEASLKGAKKWAVVEINYTGQFERLLSMELGRKPDAHIRKYTGRAFTAAEIVEGFKKEVRGQ
jgi:2-oxoglutarate/2-oxoacid ferredoxin oxidoreductase subunit alpha